MGAKRTQMDRVRLFWLIGYVLLVFTVSTRPGLGTAGPEFHSKDKVAHLAEYAILGVLLHRAVGRSVGRSRPTTFLFLLALGATVGAIDEMLQFHTPDRSMDVLDWIADLAGVSAAVWICMARTGLPPDNGNEAL
jgi:VanZ family protein